MKKYTNKIVIVGAGVSTQYGVLHLIKNIDKNKTNDTIGNSYTVNWKKNNDATQTSYFYGSDMEDVITKFYYGKESIKHMFNIFEIKLNPIA